jgi:hypothetical protein
MQPDHLLRATGVIVALLTGFGVQASTITFDLPQNISGDADISTSGTFDRGWMFTGPEGNTLTINGVTFLRLWGYHADTQAFSLASEGFGSASAPYSTLSADYQSLLKGGIFTGGGVTATFTLANLAPGDLYEVQLFVNDSRGTAQTILRTETVNGSQPLAFNVPQAQGGLGQHILGTFTADASGSQVLEFTPGVGAVVQLNGLQLRKLGAAIIPEASSGFFWASSVASLVAYVCWCRRRV